MVKLSNGNSKTGKGLFIFNLPAITTCIGSTEQCRKACYAMKAQRMYTATREQREGNLVESLKDTFVSNVCDLIKGNKFQTYFRIHESGDFYNQDYLNKWFEIARLNKSVKFLAFTKSFNLDFTNCPKNLTIILSVFPDSPAIPKHLSKHKIAYAGVESVKGDKKLFMCGSEGGCYTCAKCWEGKKNIYFDLH